MTQGRSGVVRELRLSWVEAHCDAVLLFRRPSAEAAPVLEYANAAAARLLRIDGERLAGRPCAAVLAEARVDCLAELATVEGPLRLTCAAPADDAPARRLRLVGLPMPEGLALVFSEPDDLDAAPREAESRWRGVVETLPLPVYLAEPQTGALLWISPCAEALLGASTTEILSDPGWLRAIVRPEDRPRLLEAVQRCTRAGDAMTVDYCVRGRDGGIRWIEDTARLRVRADGSRVLLGLLRDVSARHALEAERVEAVRRLRDALAERDEFLAVAAHELRTPTTALQLELQWFARRLGRQTPLPAGRLGEIVQGALRQVRRLSLLTDALFDLTRVSTGRLQLERQETDLVAVVRAAVELHRRSSGNRVKLVAPERLVGSCDAVRLGQVVTNLLTNALKYGRGSVEVELAEGDDEVRMVVRDHGPGIPQELQRGLFQRFARGSRRDGSGLGLGLFISRQIVEAHGGRIALVSRPHEGTTLTVTLPHVEPAPLRPGLTLEPTQPGGA